MTDFVFYIGELDVEPNEEKCGSCRWQTNDRYLMAPDEEEAIAMVNGDGDRMQYNGFCGSCIAQMITKNQSSLFGGDEHRELEKPE